MIATLGLVLSLWYTQHTITFDEVPGAQSYKVYATSDMFDWPSLPIRICPDSPCDLKLRKLQPNQVLYIQVSTQ